MVNAGLEKHRFGYEPVAAQSQVKQAEASFEIFVGLPVYVPASEYCSGGELLLFF